MEKTLHLPLKAKWYRMTESGIKEEDYREIKPYWIKRLVCRRDGTPLPKCYIDYFSSLYNPSDLLMMIKHQKYKFKKYSKAELSYGYTKRRMTKEIDYITIGTGKPEWGAEPNKLYFVIKYKTN